MSKTDYNNIEMGERWHSEKPSIHIYYVYFKLTGGYGFSSQVILYVEKLHK